MNTYLAWQKPLLRLAGENLLFFSPGYRPFGNLVYRLLFEMAGFHPLPFRIACFALLFLNLYLAYRAAAAIGGFETAVLTVLFSCYNAGSDLYHDAGIIYDILCFTFISRRWDSTLAREGANSTSATRSLLRFLSYICSRWIPKRWP